MTKKTVLALIMTAFLIAPVFAAEVLDINHLLIMPTVSGESGYINNPSAYVLPAGTFSLGLHMEKYIFKVNYGFFDLIEAGGTINFGGLSDLLNSGSAPAANAPIMDKASYLIESLTNSTSFALKGRILKEEDYFVSVCAGIRKLPLNLFKGGLWDSFAVYGVTSKKINDMSFSIGFKKTFSNSYIGFIADASKIINDTILLIAEYDEKQFNAGVKISLNYNLNVEFYVKDIANISKAGEIGNFMRQYFIFGITYLQ